MADIELQIAHERIIYVLFDVPGTKVPGKQSLVQFRLSIMDKR